MESLTKSEVLDLIDELGLGAFCDNVKSRNVDGSLLDLVESPKDIEDLGVNIAVYSRKLFQKIQEFRAVENSKSSAKSAAVPGAVAVIDQSPFSEEV